TTDPQTNIKTTTRYHQSWPLTGKPQFTKSYAGDNLITHATSTWRQHTDKQGSLLFSGSEQRRVLFISFNRA
ncbi:hypothetical protein, partial [Pseudoalteromonas rubra]|uniref:hypothetical protein n=1 Tax=Pseudoalteromonas rubra TaxID=43658 RepID=UPI0018E11F07